jgi:hypothetical protein
MPEEVLKVLTLRWKLITEAEETEALKMVREACQYWAEGEKYAVAIHGFMRQEMGLTWDAGYWHNTYGKRRWSDKAVKREPNEAIQKREEARRQQQFLFTVPKQPRGRKPNAIKGKTAVERLGGQPSRYQSPSMESNIGRERIIDETTSQPRDVRGEYTSQGKRSAGIVALSPRKDHLKRAKSPVPVLPRSPTRSVRESVSTPPVELLVKESLTTPGEADAPSPHIVYGTSRSGRVQSPSWKKQAEGRG